MGGTYSRGEMTFEVFENFPPIALVPRASPMALVDNDEVEEIRRKLTVQSRPLLVPRDSLIGSEVHLAAFYRFSLDLPAGIPEWCKGFIFWVVYEHIPIGEEENTGAPVLRSAVPAGIPEFVAYLKGDDCFAGSRGQREKYAMLALQKQPAPRG